MKALVYYGLNEKGIEERPHPNILCPTDAVVKVVNTTICGTDLNILKGSVLSRNSLPKLITQILMSMA